MGRTTMRVESGCRWQQKREKRDGRRRERKMEGGFGWNGQRTEASSESTWSGLGGKRARRAAELLLPQAQKLVSQQSSSRVNGRGFSRVQAEAVLVQLVVQSRRLREDELTIRSVRSTARLRARPEGAARVLRPQTHSSLLQTTTVTAQSLSPIANRVCPSFWPRELILEVEPVWRWYNKHNVCSCTATDAKHHTLLSLFQRHQVPRRSSGIWYSSMCAPAYNNVTDRDDPSIPKGTPFPNVSRISPNSIRSDPESLMPERLQRLKTPEKAPRVSRVTFQLAEPCSRTAPSTRDKLSPSERRGRTCSKPDGSAAGQDADTPMLSFFAVRSGPLL
ncbi:hypothetical protein K402DRAFT_255689 [Aulographum hederae CBS 113979]|uniref:Uncharacterized protein n=1 Tax=Aulographum hederae CBS 113979 TaxID=1176131 RepID=A0A6G1GJ92_9PEZI|nr:hypothetical protein K402DRAFT_255689 [Aulographum hederae CBS 113979]